MEKRYLKSAVKQLLRTEENKELLVGLLKKHKQLTMEQLLPMCSMGGFTIRKAMKLMIESGHVKTWKLKEGNKTNVIVYELTGNDFKKKTAKELKDTYVRRSTQYGYGEGEFWMPWMPKVPQGSKVKKIKLFDEKDHDYFNQPLRENKATGIGSTFSLYEGYAL